MNRGHDAMYIGWDEVLDQRFFLAMPQPVTTAYPTSAQNINDAVVGTLKMIYPEIARNLGRVLILFNFAHIDV